MPRLLVAGFIILLAWSTLAQVPVPQKPEATTGAQHHVEPPDPALTAAELEARGDDLRVQKLYSDAIDYYRAAAGKQPNRAMLWAKMGFADHQLARFHEAKKDFEHALKLDKNFPEATNNLGVILYTLKDYKGAIKQYRKAIEMRPQSATFHANLGNAYFARKEYQKANVEYARAIQIDPDVLERKSSGGIQMQLSTPQDRARYSYEVAKLYASMGNAERSLHYLRRAIEDGYPDINAAYKDKEFAGLRADPRFEQLMKSRLPAIQQQ